MAFQHIPIMDVIIFRFSCVDEIASKLLSFVEGSSNFSDHLKKALSDALLSFVFDESPPYLAQLVIDASFLLPEIVRTPNSFKDFVVHCHFVLGSEMDAETVVYSDTDDDL